MEDGLGHAGGLDVQNLQSGRLDHFAAAARDAPEQKQMAEVIEAPVLEEAITAVNADSLVDGSGSGIIGGHQPLQLKQ